MSRAILIASVARDLQREFRNIPVLPIAGATNGTLQAWDTSDREFFDQLRDPDVRVITKRRALLPALYAFTVMVLRSDSGTAMVNPASKRLADCTPSDYFRVRRADRSIVFRRRSTFLNSDELLDTTPVHHWFGEPGVRSSVDPDVHPSSRRDALD